MLNLNDERYDFFQETDFKERLWEKMRQKQLETAPARKEIPLDTLGGGKAQPHSAGHVSAKPAAAPKEHDKSR